MSTYHSINIALRELRMKTRTKMVAEVKRQQVEFSPLEHKAMHDILAFDGASQQTLVESMGKDKAQIARVVARLLRQDLIIKQENPADKRSVILALTEKGEKLYQRLNEVEMDIIDQMMSGFSSEEVESFSLLLEKANRNLK